MALDLLLNVPETRNDYDIFSFNLRTEIDKINAAILEQLNISVPAYQLDPINFDHIPDWLANVSQATQAFTAALGQQSADLLSVDLSNESQKAAWVRILYNELFAAEQQLAI